MIKFFRKIRLKLIEEKKIGNYLKYAIGEILLVVIGKISPVRDSIRVEEQTISRNLSVPLGTGYDGKSAFGKNHIAYLRHANSIYQFVFYPYSVPTGHSESYGFIKLSNLQLLC